LFLFFQISFFSVSFKLLQQQTMTDKRENRPKQKNSSNLPSSSLSQAHNHSLFFFKFDQLISIMTFSRDRTHEFVSLAETISRQQQAAKKKTHSAAANIRKPGLAKRSEDEIKIHKFAAEIGRETYQTTEKLKELTRRKFRKLIEEEHALLWLFVCKGVLFSLVSLFFFFDVVTSKSTTDLAKRQTTQTNCVCFFSPFLAVCFFASFYLFSLSGVVRFFFPVSIFFVCGLFFSFIFFICCFLYLCPIS